MYTDNTLYEGNSGVTASIEKLIEDVKKRNGSGQINGKVTYPMGFASKMNINPNDPNNGFINKFINNGNYVPYIVNPSDVNGLLKQQGYTNSEINRMNTGYYPGISNSSDQNVGNSLALYQLGKR